MRGTYDPIPHVHVCRVMLLLVDAASFASNGFTELLRRCILEESEKVIGGAVTRSLFFRLKLDQRIDDPGEFHRQLQSVLSAGAIVLEKSIVRELFRRLNISCEEERPFEFEKCVDRAKKIFAVRTEGE